MLEEAEMHGRVEGAKQLNITSCRVIMRGCQLKDIAPCLRGQRDLEEFAVAWRAWGAESGQPTTPEQWTQLAEAMGLAVPAGCLAEAAPAPNTGPFSAHSRYVYNTLVGGDFFNGILNFRQSLRA